MPGKKSKKDGETGLKIDEIIEKKLKRNNEKYPVEKAYGSKAKYTELKEQANHMAAKRNTQN